MKAIISNKIYMWVKQPYLDQIEKFLTYLIPRFSDPANPEIIKNFSIIRKQEDLILVGIPVGRTDLIPANCEIVDKRHISFADIPEFLMTLRESQAKVSDAVDDNCLINAKPGWGKTFVGLNIAGHLGQKTLVVVDTASLRNQWYRETEKVFNFSPGIIGDGKFDIHPLITIGTVQSLYKRSRQLSKEFGTLIVDEVHHVPSATFSKVVDASFARYKIGLSATLERKDGRHVMLRDYFGTQVFKPVAENTMTPKVVVIRLPVHFPDGVMDWSTKVTELMSNTSYQQMISEIVNTYTAKGHKVLIPADRKDFIYACAEMNSEHSIALTGDITDPIARERLLKEVRGPKNQIWTSTRIFKEGLSENHLSCLVLSSPINNDPLLEQLIGRIERKHPGKLQPVVIDIRLQGRTVDKQFLNRLGFYMKQGYEIEYL